MGTERDIVEFANWLTRCEPNAVIYVTVEAIDGRTRWDIILSGLPEHIGDIHTQSWDSDTCVRQARLMMQQKIAKKLREESEKRARQRQEEAERRARRCRTPTKKRFLTERSAERALEILNQTAKPGEIVPVRSYWCDPQEDGCGAWHLTHLPRGRTT
jgi:hypothetical protein